MKATASFKKFFSSSLNILTQNQHNQKYYFKNSIQKNKKELENKILLTEKKNRFTQANNEFKNFTRSFEILGDTLLITKEKRKASRLVSKINFLINQILNLSRKIEILQWEINNLSNIIEKRRIQYLQFKFDQCVLYPEKKVLQQQLNNLMLQPVATGF